MTKLKLCFMSLIASSSFALAQNAVLYTGSDWCDAGAALEKIWKDPGFVSKAQIPLMIVDEPETVTDATKRIWETQKPFAFHVDNYPAIGYFNKDKQLVLLREGVSADATADELLAMLSEGATREEQILDLLSKKTAPAAAQAITLNLKELGLKRSKEAIGMKRAWDVLRAADPEDAQGYVWGFDFDPLGGEANRIRDFATKKDYAGGEAFIATLNTPSRLAQLSTNQKQGLKLLAFVLHKDDPTARAANIKLLREVMEMDPTTHFGGGALGYLCMWGEGPVALPYGWNKSHEAQGKQTWSVTAGVAKAIPEAGSYTLKVERQAGAGKMILQSARLYRGDKLITTIDLQPAQCELTAKQTRTFDFTTSIACDRLVLESEFDTATTDGRGVLSISHRLPTRANNAAVTAGATPWMPKSIADGDLSLYTVAEKFLPQAFLEQIAARTGKSGGAAFLAAFYSNPTWMLDFFASGPVKGSWQEAFSTLEELSANEPSVLTDAAVRKWATAVALNVGDGSPVACLRLLKHFNQIRAAKRTMRGADELPVASMRFVLTPRQLDADALTWITAQHNVPPREWGGVCWFCAYRTYNFFNDSVQGPHYYRPWDHMYSWQEATRRVGGVCGSLSYYGSIAAKSHGVPSTPGGQPMHCAYCVWSAREGRWTIGYNVNRYTGAHYSLWAGEFPYLDLAMQDFHHPAAEASRRAYMEAIAAREKLELQPVISPMTVEAFRWDGRELPKDWSNLIPLAKREGVTSYDINAGGQADHVALRWQGTITMRAPASPNISIASDDGSRFILDGKTLLEADGVHGLLRKEGTPRLDAGVHPFEVQYFNLDWGRELQVKIDIRYPYNAAIAGRYAAAVKLDPLNYDCWVAYDDYLAGCTDTSDEQARAFALSAADALGAHVRVAWDLLNRHIIPRWKERGLEPLSQLLIDLHQRIRQDSFDTAEFCDFNRILNDHAKLLGDDDAKCFALFKAALVAQYGSRDAFGIVIKWGAERFLNKPAYSAQFVQALEALLSMKSDSGKGTQTLARFVSSSIRAAAMADNSAAFNALNDLNDRLNPSPNRKPMRDRCQGKTLLSEGGVLKTSSTSQWDNCAGYRHVIDGLTSDFGFHSGEEKEPWLIVTLPGKSEISGFYIENVHSQNNGRVIPFKIEVSEDGTTWHEVYRTSESRNDWTLEVKPTVGSYVRLTRFADASHDYRTFLHLRKFQVYGKKLY